MATHRKNLTAKPATRSKGLVLKSSGKGKPAAKKPSKPTPSSHSKPMVKPNVKSATKPLARAGAKPAPKPKGPPVLNKGAAAAKALAEARAAAAAKAAEAAKRPPKLVPATPNAIRPGAAKATPAKGKSAPRPPAEVRPLGVLPPEAMARPKPLPVKPRVMIPDRSTPPSARSAAPARVTSKGDDRLNDDDLKHFESRLLEERARIMREMGHLESTLLKVNPRDSAGEVGGYSFHMADAGTDSMEREISFDIASKEGRLLREIDDALRRIYNGVYGICESTGAAISRARLEALPWARYTLQEQENMERMQRAGRLVKEEE
jgi:RNA polymerase-binding transcription factor DksA